MKPGHRRGVVLAAAVGAVTLGAGALAPAVVAGADSAPSALQAKVALPQGPPHIPADAARLGSAPPDQVLDLDVALAGQDPAGLAQAVAAVSTPGSPDYRHYLTSAQYAARFGPTATEVARVSSALRAEGLSVGTPDPGSILLPVRGTAAAVSAAFGTPLESVQPPDQAPAIVNTASPQIPADLTGAVTAVVGLDGLFHEHAMLRPKSGSATPGPGATTNAAGSSNAGNSGAGSGAQNHDVVAHASTPQACPAAQATAFGGTYTSTQMSSIFGLDQLFGQGRIGLGQTIAIVEFEQYSQSDFNAFESCYGLSSSIRNVVVDGGPGGPPGGGGEAALDTELASFNAPAASLVVYETPNDNDAQALDMFNRIAGDDIAQVVTTSWGNCEAMTAGGTLQAENTTFSRLALQGQTMIAASGDSGSEDCTGSNSPRRGRPRVTAHRGQRGRHDLEQRVGLLPGRVELLVPLPRLTGRGRRRLLAGMAAQPRADQARGLSRRGDQCLQQRGRVPIRARHLLPGRPRERVGGRLLRRDLGRFRRHQRGRADQCRPLRRHQPGLLQPPRSGRARPLRGRSRAPTSPTSPRGTTTSRGRTAASSRPARATTPPAGWARPSTRTSPSRLQGADGCPSVASVSPNTGPHSGGGAVTISGGGFLNASAVTFGSAGTGQIVNQSEDSITVIPPNAPGPLCVDVTVRNSQGISATSAADHYGFDGDLNCGQGYRFVASDGGIFDYGDATFWGSTGSLHLNAPVVGMGVTPSTNGYWMVASDGGIFNYGDAKFFGSMGGQHLNKPIVGMASTADGNGYWMVAADGGIFNFGNAPFFGSTGSMRLNKPIVGMAATPDGGGYWLVASDGGIFSYGDAQFWGSAGSLVLNSPVVGMAAGPGGNGYWLVAADGGIFDYGSAGFFGSAGSIRLNQPVVGMAATSDGNGYWLVAADGGIFTYGDAPFFGSTGSIRLNKPIVGMSST